MIAVLVEFFLREREREREAEKERGGESERWRE